MLLRPSLRHFHGHGHAFTRSANACLVTHARKKILKIPPGWAGQVTWPQPVH
jgi:hypothetical protein